MAVVGAAGGSPRRLVPVQSTDPEGHTCSRIGHWELSGSRITLSCYKIIDVGATGYKSAGARLLTASSLQS